MVSENQLIQLTVNKFISALTKNDSLAKFAAKGWTCDICLVSNKDDADKCVACTTARPGAKKSNYSFCFLNFVYRKINWKTCL